MPLELLKDVTIQEGLRELVEKAYSMKQNLTARVETPVLEDTTRLWYTYLDSKTLNLYGRVNQDNRHRFKIEHDFDLSKIVNASINPDGSISTDESTYIQSQGTEFIIINKLDVKGAKADYAIRAKKYEKIREQLNKGRYKVKHLKKAAGFKINVLLTPKEVFSHDGWLELAVGKNNASEEDYAEASKFLKEKYVPKANKYFRFSDGKNMGFFVPTGISDYEVWPCFIDFSYFRSSAGDRSNFLSYGHFLRVLNEKVAP